MQNIKLCSIQTNPLFGKKQLNIDRTLSLIQAASAKGANLLVLPELCNTGYVFQSRSELYEMAEPIPDGPSVSAWDQAAREYSVYIAAGMAELDADGIRCYNTAVLIGPEGYIGHYRKLHLWGDEKLYFEPGDKGYPVFHTPIGRIGMLICYDMWFPESFRLLALKGADVICCSSDWLDHSPSNPSTMGVIQAIAGANSNHLFVVAASRTGTERNVQFAGQSLVCNINGRLLAGPLEAQKEGSVEAEVQFEHARRLNKGSMNTAFRDRRTDVYGLMLGSEEILFPR